MDSTEKVKVGFLAYVDEYTAFKAICRHELRSTPTAILNSFIRETVKTYHEKNANKEES